MARNKKLNKYSLSLSTKEIKLIIILSIVGIFGLWFFAIRSGSLPEHYTEEGTPPLPVGVGSDTVNPLDEAPPEE